MNRPDPVRDFGVMDEASIGAALLLAGMFWAAAVGGLLLTLAHLS